MTTRHNVRLTVVTIVTLVAVMGILVVSFPAVSTQPGQIVVNSATIEPREPYVDELVVVGVTVSNFENSSGGAGFKEVTLRSGGGIVIEASNLGTLGPGGLVDMPSSATLTNTGERQLKIHVSGRHESGNTINVEYPVIVTVEERDMWAGLLVGEQTNDTVNVKLINYGNTNLSNVEITAPVNGSQTAQRYTVGLDPDANRSVVFDIADMSNRVVPFTATYTVDRETFTTTLSGEIEDDSVPEEVRLMSIETTQRAGSMMIQGDVANVRNMNVSSALLTAEETANVTHGLPSGGYFIGRAETGEFATFDVTVESSGEPMTVPVRVSYITGGDRAMTTQEVPLDSGGTMPAVVGSQSK